MKRFKKIALILTILLIIFVALVIIFISPITKYLVEKYDEQYTGRQITMDWVYANPFTGYVKFNNLKIFELQSDSIFLSANDASVNFEMFKMWSKDYEISALTLDKLKGIIIQRKKEVNFDDLIQRFSSKDTSINKIPLHLNILNFKITDGEIHYRDSLIPINYFIKKVSFESDGIRWDVDSIAAKFSFQSGIKSGDMEGNFAVNLKNKDYRLAVKAHKFDLQIIEQYLKDLTNYGSFTANLDADIHSTGNLFIRENVSNSGEISINDFHFGKTKAEDYASFEKLKVQIIELCPKKRIYSYDTVSLSRPYFKYERYDYLDNLQTMFGKQGAKYQSAQADTAQFNLVIVIADYIKMLGKNLFKSDYKVNRLAVHNGNLKYNDFSKSEKFSMTLNPLTATADSIDKRHHRAKVYFKSGIKPFGRAIVTLSMNPKDTRDFDLQYHLLNLPIAMFNPYIIAYTSFPFDRGTLDFNGDWHVQNGNIQSNNHLLIIDPRANKRLVKKNKKWLPIRLILAFIRERGNVIDYEIPITGTLDKPKFDFRDAKRDLIRNILVKPPTTLYGIEVKKVENEIEKLRTLKWEMSQSSLHRKQKKFIRKMATFLKENPTATINVYPQHYTLKEKEYLLFFEAKKKYFLAIKNRKTSSFCEADSIAIEKLSIKEECFVRYLNKHTKGKMLFTIQDRCNQFVNPATINAKFEQLKTVRANAFMAFFKGKNVEKQIKIHAGKDDIPYDGFSYYKIEYHGALPQSLTKALAKMKALNDEAPRKEFKNERKGNKGN